jgi:hypothetical protein
MLLLARVLRLAGNPASKNCPKRDRKAYFSYGEYLDSGGLSPQSGVA